MEDAFFAWQRCTQSMQRRRAATLLQCLDNVARTRQQRALHVWHSMTQHSRATRQQAEALCQARQTENAESHGGIMACGSHCGSSGKGACQAGGPAQSTGHCGPQDADCLA